MAKAGAMSAFRSSRLPCGSTRLGRLRRMGSMSRTRAGLLDGAVSVIERGGLGRVTMSAVATS